MRKTHRVPNAATLALQNNRSTQTQTTLSRSTTAIQGISDLKNNCCSLLNKPWGAPFPPILFWETESARYLLLLAFPMRFTTSSGASFRSTRLALTHVRTGQRCRSSVCRFCLTRMQIFKERTSLLQDLPCRRCTTRGTRCLRAVGAAASDACFLRSLKLSASGEVVGKHLTAVAKRLRG